MHVQIATISILIVKSLRGDTSIPVISAHSPDAPLCLNYGIHHISVVELAIAKQHTSSAYTSVLSYRKGISHHFGQLGKSPVAGPSTIHTHIR